MTGTGTGQYREVRRHNTGLTAAEWGEQAEHLAMAIDVWTGPQWVDGVALYGPNERRAGATSSGALVLWTVGGARVIRPGESFLLER